ncbi:hypothetical protein CBL_10505 [Carabus blaptoides fortunei]
MTHALSSCTSRLQDVCSYWYSIVVIFLSRHSVGARRLLCTFPVDFYKREFFNAETDGNIHGNDHAHSFNSTESSSLQTNRLTKQTRVLCPVRERILDYTKRNVLPVRAENARLLSMDRIHKCSFYDDVPRNDFKQKVIRYGSCASVMSASHPVIVYFAVQSMSVGDTPRTFAFTSLPAPPSTS